MLHSPLPLSVLHSPVLPGELPHVACFWSCFGACCSTLESRAVWRRTGGESEVLCAVCCVMCAGCCMLGAGCCVLCTVCCMLCAVCSLCTVHCALYALFCVLVPVASSDLLTSWLLAGVVSDRPRRRQWACVCTCATIASDTNLQPQRAKTDVSEYDVNVAAGIGMARQECMHNGQRRHQISITKASFDTIIAPIARMHLESAFRRGGLAGQCNIIISLHHTTQYKSS